MRTPDGYGAEERVSQGGGREGEDAYFILPVVPSWRREKKRKAEGEEEERGRGSSGFTFWLINGSFFDYRLLCDAYLASLGTISLPFPCVARYSTAREKILGSMTRFLPFSSSSSSSFLVYRGCHRE